MAENRRQSNNMFSITQDGRLHVGDQLLAVNDESLLGLAQVEVFTHVSRAF